MKLPGGILLKYAAEMPPTRGHDLKHTGCRDQLQLEMMPPTRGHDLKLVGRGSIGSRLLDAPHTGARLETSFWLVLLWASLEMPPTRGHDLKPDWWRWAGV